MATPPAQNDSSRIRTGLLITTLGGLLFTFEIPLLRMAQTSTANLIFARGILLFISITAVWYAMRLYTGRKIPFIAGRAGWAVVCTNTVANLTYISAVQSTSTANVVFITALIPVATAVMSWVFLNERVHFYTWLATGLSVLGVALIAGDSVSLGWQDARGDLFAIISCLCSAACFTIVAASGKNVATSLGVGSLGSALFALLFMGPVFTGPGALDGNAWFWASLSGLLVVPAASILLSNGPRFLPSSDVSMFFLLETTLTPLWTFLLFTEIPRGNVMAGGAVVIVTLLIHSYWRLTESFRPSRASSSG